jgi:hypothetical protein
MGELTPHGMRQEFALGERLRARYGGLVNQYTRADVYVRTSDLDRCHMSAQSLLLGFFPERRGVADAVVDASTSDASQQTPRHVQPIPIHAVPASQEFLLRGFDHCAALPAMVRKAFDTPAVRAKAAATVAVRARIAAAVGLDELPMHRLTLALDAIIALDSQGVLAASGIHLSAADRLEAFALADWYFKTKHASPALGRLG